MEAGLTKKLKGELEALKTLAERRKDVKAEIERLESALAN